MALQSQFPSSDQEIDVLRATWEKDHRRLLHHVKQGKLGYNEGLKNGMQRLSNYIYGTHRGRYYLIGADSGVGKTTLADYMFFYQLFKATKALGIKLELDYYSFEISEMMKKARMASLIYWEKYKEELPSQYMLGMVPGRTVTDIEEQRLFSVAFEVEEMFDSIHFHENSATPVDIWNKIVERAGRYGEVKRAAGLHGPSEIIGYVPDPDKPVFKLTMVDHLALLEPGLGQSTKQAMDLTSTFFVRGRNLFNDSYVVVQQFNTEMQGNARENKNPMAYVPARVDFGDSRYTYRDADIVMGLIRPVDFQLNSFGSFSELESWGNYFIVNFLIKNRYGPIAGGIPYFIDPIAGIPEELPEGKNWNLLLQQLYIEKAEKLDESCRLFSPK